MSRIRISNDQREGDSARSRRGSAASAARRPRRNSERGFTLAGLLVILTIMAVFIAYTVPRQWSKVMQREREKQTMFVMKQYARAIREWSLKHGNTQPTSLDQLKEARLPRVIRGPKGEYLDPLTGKVDWILVPPTAVTLGGTLGGSNNTNSSSSSSSSSSRVGTGGSNITDTTGAGNTSTPKFVLNKDASPKDYVGPFIGVRPPLVGQSMLTLKDVDQYDQWVYTTLDLDADIQAATKVNPNQ